MKSRNFHHKDTPLINYTFSWYEFCNSFIQCIVSVVYTWNRNFQNSVNSVVKNILLIGESLKYSDHSQSFHRMNASKKVMLFIYTMFIGVSPITIGLIIQSIVRTTSINHRQPSPPEELMLLYTYKERLVTGLMEILVCDFINYS